MVMSSAAGLPLAVSISIFIIIIIKDYTTNLYGRLNMSLIKANSRAMLSRSAL